MGGCKTGLGILGSLDLKMLVKVDFTECVAVAAAVIFLSGEGGRDKANA